MSELQLRHVFVGPGLDAWLDTSRPTKYGPTNRLVADALEADWNAKLRELADAQDDYDKAKGRADRELDQTQGDLVANWPMPHCCRSCSCTGGSRNPRRN